MNPEPGSFWSEIGAAIVGAGAALGSILGWKRYKQPERPPEPCGFDGQALADVYRRQTDRIVEAVNQQGKDTRHALYSGFKDMSEKMAVQAQEVAVLKDRVQRQGNSR